MLAIVGRGKKKVKEKPLKSERSISIDQVDGLTPPDCYIVRSLLYKYNVCDKSRTWQSLVAVIG